LLPWRSRFLIFIVLVIFTVGSNAQAIVSDSVRDVKYEFINYEADTIINVSHLVPFFNKLQKLERGEVDRLNIVHIGDSHIQADFITREVRKNFQQRFGNAGRGLVFPLRVAGTNEPADYRTTSNTAWAVSKINGPNRSPEPGISGISMSSAENGSYFEITTFNHDDLDYAFDQVTLIHTRDSMQFDCRITDSPFKVGYLMASNLTEAGENTTSVQFSRPTNFVRIMSEQTESGQQAAVINGVVLQNSKPGILYHSIGINGAHFSDYNSSPLFYDQLSVLNPDLVIISLGTNEGANIKVTEDETISAVSTMVQNIRSKNPGVSILIATPADDYFRKKYKNPYLETVQRSLIKSAVAEKTACWDLYSVAGGYGSCIEWRKAAMLQHDGVHFNKQGYALQGFLLYKALIDSYLRYAAN